MKHAQGQHETIGNDNTGALKNGPRFLRGPLPEY